MRYIYVCNLTFSFRTEARETRRAKILRDRDGKRGEGGGGGEGGRGGGGGGRGRGRGRGRERNSANLANKKCSFRNF